MDFNQQLANWLMDNQLLFQENTIQQSVFNMIVNTDDFNLLNEDDKKLVLRILELSLSLSFTLKNNPTQADALINYLDKSVKP